MVMKVVFRTDASTVIGTGHVMRCLTLADALRERQADVAFVCRAHDGHLCELIEGRGYAVARLDAPEAPAAAASTLAHASWLAADPDDDATDTIAALGDLGGRPDWLVVDHYALDQRWEGLLRPHVGRIMVVDDLADRRHDCDLLLDQNLGVAGRYDGLVPIGAELLQGPRYAMLRPEFAATRSDLVDPVGECERVLVFFGGADAGNETGKALDAIEALGVTEVGFDVVIGPINPHRETIAQRAATMANVRLHIGVSDMAAMMSRVQLAVGAGGTTQWEQYCLGLPSIVISTAANQTPILEWLARDGRIVYLGEAADVTHEDLVGALALLLRPSGLRPMLSRAAAELVDGRGVDRVCSALATIPISLRPAAKADCMDLHRWRNSEEVRRTAFTPDPITEADHRAWFDAVLADPKRALLIGESEGRPVGVLRYDMDVDEAEVSIYLVPGQAGMGIGPRLLEEGNRWLRSAHPQIRRVRAEILERNAVSVRAFEKAGFAPYARTLLWDVDHE